MDHRAITERYYDMWLDGCQRGFVYSPQRNVAQLGYSEPFDIFAMMKDGDIALTYGDRAADRIAALKAELGDARSAEALAAAMEKVYGKRPGRGLKFVYTGDVEVESTARGLTLEDEGVYLEFWAAVHGVPGDWVREYFQDMVRDGVIYGVFADGVLASCTDAPSMPYMADEVCDIGINTRAEYRGQGYARQACAAVARGIAARGKCPMWSCAIDNEASWRLALSVGFEIFGETVTLLL